jgi:hypothetical protein
MEVQSEAAGAAGGATGAAGCFRRAA